MPITLRTLAIFCKVVDNYGDIGICWRLARQFAHEHGLQVTLYVDNLASFARICPQVCAQASEQVVDGVRVLYWDSRDPVRGGAMVRPDEVADLVIEFFGVDLPCAYVEAMAVRDPKPAWINYEGLSAQAWVEDCHGLPSMHSRLPLTKYFFFPGFTGRTGGVLCEAGLEARRTHFHASARARADLLARLGVAPARQADRMVSLFCYAHAPVADLFAAWSAGAAPVCCLVPEGVAADAVRTFLGIDPVAGAVRTAGALTVQVIPFLPQADYDELLWACDVNFVRGEDSFVRAQLAARPFVWHIYPQDEQLHHVKLRAFLDRYGAPVAELDRFVQAWNGVPGTEGDLAACWRALDGHLPAWQAQAHTWRARLQAHGDAAANLLALVRSRP